MGMFDTVNVYMNLPGNPEFVAFQTKDLGCELAFYELREDGILLRRPEGTIVYGINSLNFYMYASSGWWEYRVAINPDTGRADGIEIIEIPEGKFENGST